MYSIINMFGELASQRDPEDPYVTGLDLFFKSRPALDRAKLKYYGIEVAGARTKSSIYSSMLIKLNIRMLLLRITDRERLHSKSL